MTQPVSTSLEARDRPIIRTRHKATVLRPIAQLRFGAQNRQHVLSIIGPVCGKTKTPASGQPLTQQGDELRLHQAPLVMALLVPGIGKLDQQFIQAGTGKPVTQYLHRIPTGDP